MEVMVGFEDPLQNDVVYHSLKLVPWMNWDEWKFVRDSLFSSSPDSVTSALKRVSTWRSRGCTPVAIEVTASIVEIQQKDRFFRNDLNEGALQSDEMLAMLYCMAIMRLVNGVLERTRKKNEISIGEAAEAIGIPRMLIDIRHESSHRDLPSLQLARLASTKAINWLISYYWEPQEKAIPTQNNQTTNLRKEIKRKLREVAVCLKAKKAKNTSSDIKPKRVKQTEHLFGLKKFLLAGKSSLPNSTCSKKQINKSLKKILRVYSSSSPEVVCVLLEFLLSTLESSNLEEHFNNPQVDGITENKQTEFDDWRSVVLKISRKEPEFLFTLTQLVLEKIKETINCEIDNHQSPENRTNHRQIELLSFLFEWLIKSLRLLNLVKKDSGDTNSSLLEKHLTRTTLMGLLHRCLLVSYPKNKQLMASALSLAQLVGDTSLLHKLKKLSLLHFSNPEEHFVEYSNEAQKESSICQAEKKFELIRRKKQSKNEKPKDLEMGNNGRWAVTKSWNQCPIGMLPHTVGFSGRLPVLDCTDKFREWKLSDSKIDCEFNRKREAEITIEELDDTSVKKVETEADHESFDDGDNGLEDGKGHMMIDGVWRKVGEDEFLQITAAVRLLV